MAVCCPNRKVAVSDSKLEPPLDRSLLRSRLARRSAAPAAGKAGRPFFTLAEAMRAVLQQIFDGEGEVADIGQ